MASKVTALDDVILWSEGLKMESILTVDNKGTDVCEASNYTFADEESREFQLGQHADVDEAILAGAALPLEYDVVGISKYKLIS